MTLVQSHQAATVFVGVQQEVEDVRPSVFASAHVKDVDAPREVLGSRVVEPTQVEASDWDVEEEAVVGQQEDRKVCEDWCSLVACELEDAKEAEKASVGTYCAARLLGKRVVPCLKLQHA